MFSLGQSFWRNQGSAPVLDQLSVQSAAAYSVRRLKRDYAGAALRVRRSFDSAESDIGFVGNDLNTTALMNFVGSQNLLLHSDGLFTSPWIAGPAHTQTANADVAPDGTTTATLITNTNSSTGNFTYQLQSTVTGQRTFSVYGKAGTNRYLWVYGGINTTANYGALFDLQDGVFVLDRVNGSVTGASASIQSVGNGWFRCSITHTQATNSYVAVTATNNTSPTFSANNDITNCTAGTVLVWGAQLNQGTLQPYSSTTTTARDGNGFMAVWYDQGRYAHAIRRNLLTFTEEFDNAIWPASGLTITANNAVAPDGLNSADTIVETATSGVHRFQRGTGTLTAGLPVSLSVYVRRGVGARQFQLGISGGGLVARAYFDLGTGTVGQIDQCTASIQAVGAFYRVSLTATPLTTGAHFAFLAMTNATTIGSETYTGDGTSSIIIWGAQLEIGSSVTEYQPILTGIALNATQTTAANQPAIVTGGVMVTLNNRPAVDFSGTKWLFNTEVSSNAALWGNNPQTMNMVGRSSVITDRDAFSLLGGAATATNLRSIGGSPGTAWRYTAGTDAVAATPTADLSVVTGDYADSVTNLYVQGVLRDTKAGSESTTAGTLTIGARTSAGTIPWLGLAAEFTLFPSVLSTADRQTLERNQLDAYLPFILDRIAASAAAFSTRRLRSAYTGACMRVRRSSDNAELDIGFTASGDLDTAALLTHCGANDGFVTTWYDQSGNGRNLTQATAANQPQLVSAGVLARTLNGRPGMVFNGTSHTMSVASWGTIPQPFTRSYVVTRRNSAFSGHLVNSASGSPNAASYDATPTTHRMFAGVNGVAEAPFTNSESAVFVAVFNGALSVLSKNGAAATGNAGTAGFAGIQYGSFNGSLNHNSHDAHEFVVFDSELSTADRQTLERNEGAYFGITVA